MTAFESIVVGSQVTLLKQTGIQKDGSPQMVQRTGLARELTPQGWRIFAGESKVPYVATRENVRNVITFIKRRKVS